MDDNIKNGCVFGIFRKNDITDIPLVLSINKEKLEQMCRALPVRFTDCEVRVFNIDNIDVAKTRRRLEDKIRKLDKLQILNIAEGLDVAFAILMVNQYETQQNNERIGQNITR